MKFAAIFALFALAFVVAVSADDDCGVLSLVDQVCQGDATAVGHCHACLVSKCDYVALKSDTTCDEALSCIRDSGCK